MDNWKDFVKVNGLAEPPPDLPLHSFATFEPTGKQVHGKRFVNKLKDWFAYGSLDSANGDGNRNENINPIAFNHRENGTFTSEFDRQVPKKQIYLMEEEQFGPQLENNQILVEDSAKTFMTGNNIDTNNIPQFPKNDAGESPETSFQFTEDELNGTKFHNLINKPISQILKDPSILSNLSSSIHAKNVTLRSVTKRINSIANKKNETFKLIQKFLRDLLLWGQNSSTENADSIALVNEIQELFQMDLILEQKISEKLKQLTKELEYICMRQDELSMGKKNLLTALKKYDYSKNKKGEDKEETNLLKEKVIAQEKSYDTYKTHYQYAVSITARQIFKEIGIEYYERATDLKEATGNYLKKTLQKLETNNGESFVKDLEKLRVVRAERNWSKLNSEEKNNPQSWINLISGKYDGNDTLMRKICEGLPQAYTPIPKNIPLKPPKLSFQSGLEESLSGISTNRFNPITSNEFFSEKSPIKDNEDELDKDLDPDETSKMPAEINDENDTLRRSLNPNLLVKENEKISGNILSLRKNTNAPDISKNSGSIDRHIGKLGKPTERQNKGNFPIKDGSGNGFILNFGDISQQFSDAEKHLEENRWIESPL